MADSARNNMALVIRTITNAGNQLFSPSGVLLAGVTITLDLVNQSGAPVDVWDAKSKEHVGPIRESVITDNYGEFTIAVWPNSRGNIITKYLCRVHSPGFKPFFAALPEADLSPIKWVDFMANSQPLTSLPFTMRSRRRVPSISASDPELRLAPPANERANHPTRAQLKPSTLPPCPTTTKIGLRPGGVSLDTYRSWDTMGGGGTYTQCGPARFSLSLPLRQHCTRFGNRQAHAKGAACSRNRSSVGPPSSREPQPVWNSSPAGRCSAVGGG